MDTTDTTDRNGLFMHRGVTIPLLVVSAYAVIAAGALWWFDGTPTAVRIPVALPLLLFAPGFAVVTALLPPSPTGEALSGIERAVLAVIVSMMIVPMVAFVTTVSSGLDLAWILAGVCGITITAAVIGIVRTPDEIATHPPGRYRSQGRGSSVLTDGATLLAVAITVLLLVASAAVAYSGNDGGPLATEFYLVDETGETIPETGSIGETYELRIGHDGSEQQRYTVIVAVDESGTSEPGSDDRSGTELDRSSVVVEQGETVGMTVSVPESGLETPATMYFLLFTGEAPENVDTESAHRVLELTVTSPTE